MVKSGLLLLPVVKIPIRVFSDLDNLLHSLLNLPHVSLLIVANTHNNLNIQYQV